MKALVKHYLKKDMKPVLSEVKTLTEKCKIFETKIETLEAKLRENNNASEPAQSDSEENSAKEHRADRSGSLTPRRTSETEEPDEEEKGADKYYPI